MIIHTPRGWRRLVRMYVPELREASKQLPGADLETVRRRAFEIIANGRVGEVSVQAGGFEG